MKWLLVLFMFFAVSMSLISCSKKDDGPSTPTTLNCAPGGAYGGGYRGGYPQPRQSFACRNQGGQAVCLYDEWENREVQVEYCGMRGGQPMGITPDEYRECIPAAYCY